MGWLIVLFDLPTDTKDERHQAAKFRNGLLDLGYLMLQYSVYARYAVTLDKKKGFINDIKKIAPTTGNVQCYFITDIQWEECITITKIKEKAARQIDNKDNISKQLQFW
ncbi:MAG: CRISPR-associated endonuclease Cas2 [Candidatus Endomicrobiellum trichonymphae]|uniref:CRISPR-associated endonuclease Cas2 n=1 Tax=Endomicrobium trichonymphae TaxID=1408204 RepID=UPI0027D3BBA4|nr:MAG: CRISPR-associated endonuclease Cas2 [Candidatus Endomicrobium trichonymphae]